MKVEVGEMVAVTPRKVSANFIISEAQIAMEYGFRRLGHMEPVTPTPEQVAAHARAEELLREVEENPYIYVDGYDGGLVIEPLQTERWVFDETDDEWMTRWREHRAAHPDEEPPQRSWIDQMAARMFSTVQEPSPTLNMALWRRPEPECKGAPSD